jgi:hypothetical protein
MPVLQVADERIGGERVQWTITSTGGESLVG